MPLRRGSSTSDIRGKVNETSWNCGSYFGGLYVAEFNPFNPLSSAPDSSSQKGTRAGWSWETSTVWRPFHSRMPLYPSRGLTQGALSCRAGWHSCLPRSDPEAPRRHGVSSWWPDGATAPLALGRGSAQRGAGLLYAPFSVSGHLWDWDWAWARAAGVPTQR